MSTQSNSHAKRVRKPFTKTTKEMRLKICEEVFGTTTPIVRIAAKYGVPDSTVRGIVKRCREDDTVDYKKRGGPKHVKIKEQHSAFLRDVIHKARAGDNALTLKQLRQKLMVEFPADFPEEKSISLTALQRHIVEHLQLSLKRSWRSKKTRQ